MGLQFIHKNNMIINSKYYALLHKIGLDCFENVWGYSKGTLIKKIKQRSIICIEIKDKKNKFIFYLKKHNRVSVGLKGIFRLFFKKAFISEGRKEFENISSFLKNGISTVTVVAMGERFINFFWVESFIITKDFSPYVSLETLLKKSPDFFLDAKIKKNLIEKIATVARKMHESGFNHQDFNTTHILVNYKNLNEPDIALFDLQRVSRRRFFKFRWPIKCLARLNYSFPNEIFSENDRIYLFQLYKGKKKLNMWDRFQLFWIKRKTARIKRHTEKIEIKKQTERKSFSRRNY